MSKTNWSKQTQTGKVGVDLGTVSRSKTTVVAVITGCSLACWGSGWVRGWVLGTWVGKSLLWFLVDIHLSWLCQPPTFSILEQWQRKHWDLCLCGMWYCNGPDKTSMFSWFLNIQCLTESLNSFKCNAAVNHINHKCFYVPTIKIFNPSLYFFKICIVLYV